MECYAVPFGDGVGFNVKCDTDKAVILRALEAHGVRPLLRDRDAVVRYGPDAATVIKRQQDRFVATLLPRGLPGVLFLTRIGFAGAVVFVERQVRSGHFYPRMVLLRMTFLDPELFADTVFDGALSKRPEGRHTFVATDMPVLRGKSRLSATERLFGMRNLLRPSDVYVHDETDAFRVQATEMCDVRELRDALRRQQQCRGVCFRAIDNARNIDIVAIWGQCKTNGRRPGMTGDVNEEDGEDADRGDRDDADDEDEEEKKKEEKNDDESDHDGREEHGKQGNEESDEKEEGGEPRDSSPFFVKRTAMPDVYELFVELHNGTSGAPADAFACVPSMHASRYMAAAFESKAAGELVLMRFLYNTRFKKWVPVC